MNFIHVFLVVIFMNGYANIAQGSCNPKLESVIFDDLLTMMLKIKGTEHGVDQAKKSEIPAFGASTGISKDLADNEIVKFEKVWTNIGNGYDSNTGIFTVPISGVYHFSCSAMAHVGKALRLHLFHNELQTVSMHPGNPGVNMGTLNMVLDLIKGDRVYIKYINIGGENNLYSESRSHFSMFSGFMISK